MGLSGLVGDKGLCALAPASPLHGHQETEQCGSAHISGRSGANSCPGSSLFQLWGTRWNQLRIARPSTRRHQPPKPQPALLLRDHGVSLGVQLHPAPASCTPHSFQRRGGDHTQQVEKCIWNHTMARLHIPRELSGSTLIPSFPLLSPSLTSLTKVNRLLATWAGPAHGSACLGKQASHTRHHCKALFHWLRPLLSFEPTELSWCSFDTRNLEPFHLGDVGNFSVTSKSIKASNL